METLLWKFVAAMSLVVAFISVIIGIVAMNQANCATPKFQLQNGYPASCNKIRGQSGMYTIQPITGSPAFQVYCDMDSVGGGWTLIASIHENNIAGKCTEGDKWSSEQGASNPKGSNNWENKNAFGDLETITNQDYKNPAYYNTPANDVMLWHVPNEMKIFEINTTAFLKYYTNNNFLNASTLQQLYKEDVPLTNAVGGLDPLVQAINASSSIITSLIPDWNNYIYDGGRAATSIRDGGDDMYDSGNRVAFATDKENFTQLVYNTPYFLIGSGIEVQSSAGYPFVTLAWVGNGFARNVGNSVQYFDLKVESNYGADGQGGYSTFENRQIFQGDMIGMFTAFNVVNTSDPSVCEVFFYIANKKIWHSTLPSSMKKLSWGNSSAKATNIVRYTGSPTNVLIGYTLLSKSRGKLVSSGEVEAVIRKYMEMASSFQFHLDEPRVTAPINYIVGDNSTIMNGIPTLHRKNVDPGFIQFRAFNSAGVPNALCPGIRLNSDSPEQMCVGGTSTPYRDINKCGDFAGWSGEVGDPGSQTKPSRTGKSLNDINSSILIFIR